MCGIYCVYKQSRSCQRASPIFHFEIRDFSVYRIYVLVMSRPLGMLPQ